jgi:hypothetical protein
VRAKGVRSRNIPVADVAKLMRRLHDAHFFEWDEANLVCLDLPVVEITARDGARQKHVSEGCNQPGKIVALADEIDRLARTDDWVKRRR